MPGENKKPVAFVTGSSRGIGAAVALEFAKAGYDLALHHRNSETAALSVKEQAAALGARAVILQGDISVLEDIDRLFGEFSRSYDRLDVMVNNAGVTKFSPFLDVRPELFEELINTDFRGTFFCAQQAARIMTDKGIRGVIINITSNHQKGCWPIANVYAASKAAVNKLTENIALELAPYGIRAVSIAPGYTKTREFPKKPPPGFPPEQWEKFLTLHQRLPLGRVCEPWEIGRASVFLAGEGAGYITGACLYMDGGALLPVAAENTFS
ncbi:MAG: SDR family oxidoreductase [Clostridiales bacterium]|jgi:glucose 1-dehydrogenase|nr:SDR family oxidoreductase [Clostridiales bacterium]